MIEKINRFLDVLSEFIAARKGLLPVVGLIFIGLNLIIRIFPAGWLSETDLFLHLGLILAILGFLLARALLRT